MKKAVVIGSGFGGLSVALRLQRQGYETTILEKRDKPGGRAYVIQEDGYTFDCGPTIITAPYLIDELFELYGKKTDDYVEIVPIDPYYRVYFEDGDFFHYNGDLENQLSEVRKFNSSDVEGYKKFVEHTEKILQKGYIELGTVPFESLWDMLKITPDLISLDVVKNMYQYAAKFFDNEELRQVFSFHSLLIGGNPFNVSAIYALIPALERRWGVHFAMGGTGAIVAALSKLFEEEGGRIELNQEVASINIEKRRAKSVSTRNGDTFDADLVVSNADFANTYMQLIDESHRSKYTDRKVKNYRYSMSSVILFFGFKRNVEMDLVHHNIILTKRYRELLRDIFDTKILAPDFSQYLHIPTLTDPTLAPEGHHAAYTLIPVPNLSGSIDWNSAAEPFTNTVLDYLDERYMPGLRENLTYLKTFTPLDFESELNSYLGTGWGVEPRLTQSATFRPHNRSEDIDNLYLVGASTHPGAGIPGVISTAKVTADLIAKHE